MADEDDVPQVERVADVEDVLGVAVQLRVPRRDVGREIRAPEAHVVEHDHPEAILERRRDVPPHPLVAPEPVGEDDRLPFGLPGLHEVVAADEVHPSEPIDARPTP